VLQLYVLYAMILFNTKIDYECVSHTIHDYQS